MLTKRTQILFNDELWKILARLAGERKTSIGELVRQAAREKYVGDNSFQTRQEAVEKILKHRPIPFKDKIDYKALTNAGRKNL